MLCPCPPIPPVSNGSRTQSSKLLAVLVCAVLAGACPLAEAERAEAKAGERIPVLAWGGPPASEANVQRFRELAECGFTHSFSGFANADDMARALDAANRAGIKLLVSCPELEAQPEPTVRRFKDHPALGGYFLTDEPSAGDFPKLARWAGRIKAADPDHVIYVNLFPDYANSQQLGVGSYQQYVEQFVKQVPVPILSFDYYPIVGNSVRDSWYANLETIMAASRASGKPFWAFALSLAHYAYPTPTVAHLREQVYSDLAYGAQGIQYFTYWAVKGLGDGAPIDPSGKRTPVYDRVRSVNKEIRNLSAFFAGAKVMWVRHTGSSIPAGTRRFEPQIPVESLTTQGAGAVVSRLNNGERQLLLVVNRDINKSLSVSVRFSNGVVVARVQKNGTEQKLETATFQADAEPGDALLFTWPAGR